MLEPCGAEGGHGVGALVRPILLALNLFAAQSLLAGDAAAIVSRHLARFGAIRSLVLRVERRTTFKGKTSTERWTYRQKGGERFRVDYEFPTRRLIVCNGEELWEYIPAARKAARTRLAALGQEERGAVVRATLRRVALEGLRFEAGGPRSVLRYLGTRRVAGRLAHGVECSSRSDGEQRVVRGWIDAERLVLLSCEFLGADGQPALRIEASRFAEAAPGLWLPRQLRIDRLGPRGRTELLTLRPIALNRGLPDGLFDFKVPEGVEVIGERR